MVRWETCVCVRVYVRSHPPAAFGCVCSSRHAPTVWHHQRLRFHLAECSCAKIVRLKLKWLLIKMGVHWRKYSGIQCNGGNIYLWNSQTESCCHNWSAVQSIFLTQTVVPKKYAAICALVKRAWSEECIVFGCLQIYRLIQKAVIRIQLWLNSLDIHWNKRPIMENRIRKSAPPNVWGLKVKQ